MIIIIYGISYYLFYVLKLFNFMIYLLLRPSKLYMSDSVNTPPLSPLGSSATQSNVPTTRAPLERSPHSVDLDITLEDKDKV